MSSDMCSHGRCENFMGGYECVCDPGYKSNRQKTGCVGELSTTLVVCLHSSSSFTPR